MYDISRLLRDNPYPGRGIVLGRSGDDRCSVLAYFIMGRSANSRNRVFVRTDDGIRAQAFDPAAMTDPKGILYNPVRRIGEAWVVSNGDQTDAIRDCFAVGRPWEEALRASTFKQDAPDFTPRISGLLYPDGHYALSILKAMEGSPRCSSAASSTMTCRAPGWDTSSTPTRATARRCRPSAESRAP